MAVDRAVATVLDQGYRTADLAPRSARTIGTREMGRRVADQVTSQLHE